MLDTILKFYMCVFAIIIILLLIYQIFIETL